MYVSVKEHRLERTHDGHTIGARSYFECWTAGAMLADLDLFTELQSHRVPNSTQCAFFEFFLQKTTIQGDVH